MILKKFHDKNIEFLNHLGVSADEYTRNVSIAIVLDDDLKNNYNAQIAYILASNMCSRLFLNVDFIIPQGVLIHSNLRDAEKSLSEYVKIQNSNIFSNGNFNYKDTIQDESKYKGILHIGKNKSKQDHINVISDGWYIYLNRNCSKNENRNAVGACGAACFGVAEIFKLVMKPKNNRLIDSLIFSLLDYSENTIKDNPELPNEISIDEVTLIGAGAIGSAFIYVLQELNKVKGTLNVVDRDKYSETNLNRYVIANDTNVGNYKTDIAESVLRHHDGLTVNKYNEVYDDYIKENNKIDTLISAVDKRVTRYNMQGALPKLIIDASTSGTQVDVMRIDFGSGKACLGCIYKPDEFDISQYKHLSDLLGLDINRTRFLYDSSNGLEICDIEIIANHLEEGMEIMKKYLGEPIDTLYQQEFCGSGRVVNRKSNQDVVAPISFISVLAGVFEASELIKDRYFPEYKINNTFVLDTIRKPNQSLHISKEADHSCVYCSDSSFLKVYKKMWAN